MITIIRKSFKSNIYKIILWIVLLGVAGVFSLVELVKFALGGDTAGWVLQVNGNKISKNAYARKVADFQERMRMLRAQYGEYADMIFQMMKESANPKIAAVDMLIQEELLNQAVRSLPFNPAPEYIADMMHDIMFVQKELSDVIPLFTLDQSGNINMQILRTYLQRMGISSDMFDAIVANAIKRTILADVIVGADYVPLFELKRTFIRDYSAKKYSIVTIPFAKVLEEVKKKAVTNEEVKAFFEKNSNRYYIAEKRNGQSWTFDPADFGITISDNMVNEYYQKNKSNYLEKPMQVQVRSILFKIDDQAKVAEITAQAEKIRSQALANPAQFATLAQQHSHDTESAKQGGLLPFFSKGEREATFERASFVLKEDGDISPLVSTSKGIEIIQRVGKKLPVYKPVSQVSSAIKTTLLNQAFSEQFNREVRALMEGSHIQSQKLVAFVQDKKGKAKPVHNLGLDGSMLAKSMFRVKSGETAFYAHEGKGVIVTVGDITERHLPAFDAVKATVTDDLYNDLARKELAKEVDQVAKAACTQALTTKYGSVEKTDWIKKDDAAAIAALEKKGIPATKLFQLENVGSVDQHITNISGMIFKADAVAPFDQTLFEQKQAEVRRTLEEQRSSLIMAGFVASLFRNATINRNESQLNTDI